ncbi:hypothetical protein RJ640_029389 [Escallonia rubra]|uniref:TIR domain-containing protein n=1 Tax=Escallonia rubra TaxID=112253 RepID=A0AA88ULW1_9ASTE|nr:hypothetical protein RJ640_029389 [Escallonia rubra]
MATTSSSPFAYHVFLNFRGKDTRKTFTGHLYTYLLNAGFQTFRDDDSIERGKCLHEELPKAIKQSRMWIVVLSENYASSRWCLRELVAILECNKERGAAVLPVFYRVQPSEVGKLEGNFKTEFETYENEVKAEGDHKRRTELAERVEEWKAALRQVAELTGLVYQANEPESEFIQKIVKVVGEKVKRIALNVCRHPIGLDRRAQDINSWLQDESNDVPIVAIWGIGGMGKTTIAKYLYNLNFERFEGSSFLARVRQVSEQTDGLVRLQRQLLSDILKGKKEKIHNVDQGIVRIKEALRCIKVLVVLDDVDEVDQLHAVLEMRDWLYPGSKIIITTTRKQLLMASEFHTVHEVIEMNNIESLELFSWYAFGQDHPNEGYMDYSERVVHYCDGLPLALQVLGSSLSVKSIDVWESAVQKLEAIPNGEILKKLQISYDSLKDDHDKNLFLDIACFFVGKDKDWTITVLDGCGSFTKDGIDNLINRCLLIVDRDNKLWMHHHLIQEMGREIVRQESTEEPGGRSRLWQQEAFDVLSGNTGTEKIRGLILNIQKWKKSTSIETTTTYDWKYFGDKSSKQCHSGFLSRLPMYSAVVEKFFSKPDQLELQTSAFSRMSNLKLLQLSDIRLIGGYHEFPKIRWLCYDRFPSTTIPPDFPLQNLDVLEMRCSSLKTFWIGTKPFISLKRLDLRGSHGLVSAISDFSLVPNLERLDIAYCTNLIEVNESIEDLRRLVLLDLEGCENLRKFPANIHQLKSLKELYLLGCSKLHDESPAYNTSARVKSWLAKRWRKNPEPFRFSFPSSLVTLNLEACNLTDSCLPKDFGGLGSLELLSTIYRTKE